MLGSNKIFSFLFLRMLIAHPVKPFRCKLFFYFSIIFFEIFNSSFPAGQIMRCRVPRPQVWDQLRRLRPQQQIHRLGESDHHHHHHHHYHHCIIILTQITIKPYLLPSYYILLLKTLSCSLSRSSSLWFPTKSLLRQNLFPTVVHKIIVSRRNLLLQ